MAHGGGRRRGRTHQPGFMALRGGRGVVCGRPDGARDDRARRALGRRRRNLHRRALCHRQPGGAEKHVPEPVVPRRARPSSGDGGQVGPVCRHDDLRTGPARPRRSVARGGRHPLRAGRPGHGSGGVHRRSAGGAAGRRDRAVPERPDHPGPGRLPAGALRGLAGRVRRAPPVLPVPGRPRAVAAAPPPPGAGRPRGRPCGRRRDVRARRFEGALVRRHGARRGGGPGPGGFVGRDSRRRRLQDVGGRRGYRPGVCRADGPLAGGGGIRRRRAGRSGVRGLGLEPGNGAGRVVRPGRSGSGAGVRGFLRLGSRPADGLGRLRRTGA